MIKLSKKTQEFINEKTTEQENYFITLYKKYKEYSYSHFQRIVYNELKAYFNLKDNCKELNEIYFNLIENLKTYNIEMEEYATFQEQEV